MNFDGESMMKGSRDVIKSWCCGAEVMFDQQAVTDLRKQSELLELGPATVTSGIRPPFGGIFTSMQVHTYILGHGHDKFSSKKFEFPRS
jgi:hypothetical protein